MKKKRIQGLGILIAGMIVIGVIAAYSYSADLTRQKGLQFGAELELIQGDVRQLQTEFYSETAQWMEGDITTGQILEFYEGHLEEFGGIIIRYDRLDPPEIFEGAVRLLEISSQTQLESDKEYAMWAETGDESHRVRSDTLLQESLEYEALGIGEFNAAKAGVISYDREPFTAPRAGLVERIVDTAEGMVERCDAEYRNADGGFDTEQAESDWNACADAAQKWKEEHIP